jgi:hypothetical protein
VWLPELAINHHSHHGTDARSVAPPLAVGGITAFRAGSSVVSVRFVRGSRSASSPGMT